MEQVDLPQGWIAKNLGEVLNLSRGSSPRPIVNYITNDNNGVNWIKISDGQKGYKYIHSTKEKITTEGAKKSRSVSRGDLILSNSMSLGEAYIMDIDGYIHDGWFVLRTTNFDIHYLYYLLISQTVTDQFHQLAVGGVVKNIRSDLVNRVIIPIASLAEQQEIVRVVESHLQLVDQIKSRLDALPKILEQFRQSVLTSAVSGKLTGIEVKENRVLEDYVFIENGARKPVSATIRKTMQGEIPYIGATGIIDYLNDYTHIGRYLLVGEDGANLLTKMKDLAFILNGEMWVNNHAHVLKEKEGVDLNFIKIAINAMDLKPWVTGSAQPKLTQRALRVLPIPYYLESEQKEIVKWVENLFTLADQIESKIKHAQERVNLLTQSILAKAFRGEFTAKWREDNPDLISGENSAEALLKRIEEAKKKSKKK